MQSFNLYASLIAVAVSLGVFLVLEFIKRIVLRRLSNLTRRTKFFWDDFVIDLVRGTKDIFLIIFSIYIGLQNLGLSQSVLGFFQMLVIFSLLIQVGFWLTAVIEYLIGQQVNKNLEEKENGQATALNSLRVVLKGVVWAVVVVLVLDNIPGVEINSLIASLGITGIAVGLAVQNILSDLFASLSITIDKPFVIGDFIEVDDLSGTIEKIGLKSTRVRSLSGEQLVFANSDLLGSRIRNYQRMNRRRVVLRFGVTYQTSPEKLEAIPKMIKEAVDAVENATFTRAHLAAFGSSSLDFETVYFIENSDYDLYMDIQQAVNLRLLNDFQQAGIQFAYPTQTLYVQQEDKAL